MSTTEAEATAEVVPLQIELLPRPGKERQEYERSGIMPPQADSVLELTWCVAKSISDDLKQTERKLDMLVVVSQDGREMSRDVVPFEKGYHYIRFYRPGKNIVHVTGVWPYFDKPAALLAKNKDGDYNLDLLDMVQPGVERIRSEIRELYDELDRLPGYRRRQPRHEYTHEQRSRLVERIDELDEEMRKLEGLEPKELRIAGLGRLGQLGYEARREVNVDPAHFAENLPVTRWLANVWPYFRAHPSPDGCTTRRRAYFYTLPSIWAYGIYLVLKMAGALALLALGLFMGFRNLNPKPLWRPWQKFRAGQGVIPFNPSSVWFQKPDGEMRSDPLLVINPPIVFVSALVASIVIFGWARIGPRLGWTDRFTHLWAHGPWWFYLVIVLGPAGLASLALLLMAVGSGLGFVASTSPFVRLSERRRKRREQRREEEEEEYRRQVEMLTCDSGNALKAPRVKPPMLLSYSEVKARYCKPHALK